MDQAGALLLVLLALAFAWSMGAHYTGACMGMPYASGSIRLWPALGAMAVLSLVGAALASHKVEVTVGLRLLDAPPRGLLAPVVIVGAAFLLTTVYTYARIPTSTIQILVFCVAGAGLGGGAGVRWDTIGRLAALWVAAPLAACALGWAFTHAITRAARPQGVVGAGRPALRVLLVLVGAAASFTMGANDVANATGVFVMTHRLDVWAAGALGGAGLAVGVLTWGRPLLETVAFDIVTVDLAMAGAAQWVQALVVLTAVAFGYFTSMNQALIGAMIGAGLARGRRTVHWRTLRGILLGWAVGPASGLVLGYGLMRFGTVAVGH